jgi:serine/threonine protein phosphatase PrpC
MAAMIDVNRELCKRNSKKLHDKERGEYFSKAILQNRSKQDACGFVRGDEYSILWCSDSHGQVGNKYFIRDFFNNLTDEQWFEYLSQEDFYLDSRDENGQYISQLFKDIDQTTFIDIGATLSIVKIYPDRFECYRVGDSPIFVWRDNNIILYSNHDDEKSSDIIELKKRKYFKNINMACVNDNGVVNDKDICALSPSVITIKLSEVIWWDCLCSLNMSRAIGHNSLNGFQKRKEYTSLNIEPSLPKWEMTKHIIERIPGTKEKVVVSTDGISNVTGDFDIPNICQMTNASDIIYFAYMRWKQPWTYRYNGYPDSQQTLPDWNRDDMAVVAWNNTHS